MEAIKLIDFIIQPSETSLPDIGFLRLTELDIQNIIKTKKRFVDFKYLSKSYIDLDGIVILLDYKEGDVEVHHIEISKFELKMTRGSLTLIGYYRDSLELLEHDLTFIDVSVHDSYLFQMFNNDD